MTLVLVELLSGRRHQIRVHLSSQGHPVVGDTLYGAPASKLGLALHAWREVFNHPITGEEIKLETPWPARFSQLGFTADYASQIAMDKESGRGEGRGDELGGEAKG
jgi:23S rRNA pseudouridine1911/1915/1917 synthase